MRLDDVNRGINKNRARTRIGRGIGSGHGKTAGRGHKGAKSRAGYSRHPVFQGGAMPLVRRVPKRGFNNKWALTIATINVGDLEVLFAAGDEVSSDTLREKGVLKHRYDLLKILGNGTLTKSLKVSADRFSKSAEEAIGKAGGQVTIVPGKVTVAEKRRQAKRQKAK